MNRAAANEKIYAFYYETLNFCGCGDPQHIIDLVREEMEWAAAIQTREGRQSSDTQLLLAYILDAHDLTEHGGSITGCWLTPAGADLLEALRSCNDNWLQPS